MSALEGIRVIDFGQYVAGPLAAVMLADQGADVIHVDPPEGPRWRSDADAFFQRGKRRISLDLKSSHDDRQVAQRLVDTADVVIENFRPGVMARLDLDPDSACQRNPRLVYCSIPGFASDDPRAQVAAWEGVVGAATDTYALAGELLDPEELRVRGLEADRPVFTALPLASNFAGFHAATAIVMALIARERSGLGQRIEVPLFDAMFELIGANGIALDGVVPVGRARGSGTYLCGDGRRILFNSSSSPRFLRWFARATGVEDWADEGLLDAWRLENDAELRRRFRARLRELFLSRPAAEWEAAINAAGGPTAMVRSAAEWLGNEHARRRRTVIQLDDPKYGPTWMAGIQAHLSESPSVIRGPRHRVDADRAAILEEYFPRGASGSDASAPPPRDAEESEAQRGAAPERDAHQVQLGGALEGVRVLDLTQVVAGPCTGRILVEYGAEVIKINDPDPEFLTTAVSLSLRPTDPGNQQHEHLNRGKKSMLLDLHAPDGLRVFNTLVEHSHVVMQNFAKGTAERYGIAYEQLRERNPDLIYFSLSAYGYGGPMETYRGYEGNAQAVTGLMDRFGGDAAPLGQPYLLDDYGTGVRGAFAIGLAVYHRLRTGAGQHVNISLVETASYHQAAYLLDYPGKVRDEPHGTDALGSGPLQRLYRAADGWFFLGARDASQLAKVQGLEDVVDLQHTDLEHALEARLRSDTVDLWVSRLRAADVGAHGMVRTEELMDDPWVRDHGLSLTQEVPQLGSMRMPGVAVRMSQTPLRVGAPVNPVGADGASVLAQIGMDHELDHLIASGAMRLTMAREADPSAASR